MNRGGKLTVVVLLVFTEVVFVCGQCVTGFWVVLVC